jgi:hypothetical protein
VMALMAELNGFTKLDELFTNKVNIEEGYH